MGLFEEDHFGKPISEGLSRYIQKYTDKYDRADVSVKTKVGTSTIRDVVYRTNSLTKNNSKAILELMRISVINCTQRIEKAYKAKEELETMLSQ